MTRILIIEDEARMRKNMLMILKREGFQALGAANGSEGIVIAKRELPDLILCDVMMPEVDGYGVLGALRAERATETIPFIFLTAKSGRGDVRAGMNLGADDYLVKPVVIDDLLAAIRARLDRRAQHQRDFRPVFDSPAPLEKLGLTPRESEVLFWAAQGKTNGAIAIILGASEGTIRKHLENIFGKLAVENRAGATLLALEALSSGV
jgi:DNA-binding NarL/FixJ family response regulator